MGKPSVRMELLREKETMLEFLLQLLKEEREKRREAESEVVILKTILEPLQQKEVDHYQKKRDVSIQNIRENYYRKQPHKHGRVVCDGGTDDGEVGGDPDIIDSLSGGVN